MQLIGPTRLFAGIKFFTDTKERLLDKIAVHIAQAPDRDLWIICTPNPEQIMLSRENPEFLRVVQTATLNIPDGWGVVWALKRFKIQDSRFKRITGREVFHDLLEMAEKREWSVFLLGGRPGAAKKIVDQWISRSVDQNWKYDQGPKENETEIMEKIRGYRPDLLFVAYGAPDQELWIAQNREELKRAGVKVAMVVGGAFEYEAGLISRVSLLVEKLHLEWLQRLLTEPWRWKRQLRASRFFPLVLLGQIR